MKKIFGQTWEVLKIVIMALAIVIPIRYFIFQPFIVKGQSMEPGLQDGNYLIVDELSYRFRQPARGEVIVFHYPFSPSQRYIKRIIGLPGETVEIKDNAVRVFSADGREIFLKENSYLSADSQTLGGVRVILGEKEYFVLGDNRLFSSDSRSWGILPRDKIVGRALLRLWPLAEIIVIIAPAY